MTTKSEGRSLTTSWALVALAYVVATIVAALVVRAMGTSPTWVRVAAADAAATVAVFAFSVVLNNSSMYDAYWSVAPMVIAPWLWLATARPEVPTARALVVIALVLAWGARLTWNWARGWSGLGHEDWRYVDLRRSTGRAYWLVSLVGLHMMPTVSVFLGCLALFPGLSTGAQPLGVLDACGLLVTAAAIALEATADAQLRAFRRSNPAPARILDTGLWAYSRHPNYLGEISFWWGLSLFGLAAAPRAYGVLAGPLWITGLFVFVSVPLLDKRSLARRPAYAEHMARVPALFPRLFRRARTPE